jgi:hypothetical protein
MEMGALNYYSRKHFSFFLSFFLFAVLRLELGLHLEPLHQPFFVKDFFQDRVSRNYLPGWLRTTVLQVSAS